MSKESTSSAARSSSSGDQGSLAEVRSLVVTYARQETIDPLKNLGRYIGVGAGGAICVGAGVFFIVLGTLRGLQVAVGTGATGHNRGFLSVVPYAASFVVGAAVIAACALAIKGSLAAGRRKAKAEAGREQARSTGSPTGRRR